MKILKKSIVLVLVSLFMFALSVLQVMAKEKDLSYLDVDLKTLSVSGRFFRKEFVSDEVKAINLVNKKYNKLSDRDKCDVFVFGFFQSSFQNRKLFKKLKKDFCLKSIPDNKTKHRYFDFSKSGVLTTKDFEMYNKLFKWSPKGTLTPYRIDLQNLQMYFLDESGNFSYVAKFKLLEKSKKIEIITFTSHYYPLTPYIFFAGYMGYPDIPEASPDYK